MNQTVCILSAGGVARALLIFCLGHGVFAQGQETGAISGHVYESDGVTPIPWASVAAAIPRDNWFWKEVRSASDGSYLIANLPVGEYQVSAGVDGHVNQTFDRAIRSEDVKLVKVAAGNTTAGIDFFLEKGGSLSGHIYDADTGLPIPGMWVEAGGIDLIEVGGVSDSQSDGSYIIQGKFPTGYFSVNVPHGGQPTAYIRNPDSAKTVYVHSPDTTFGVDFYLKKGGAVSGRIFEEDGITPIARIPVHVTSIDGRAERGAETGTDGRYVVPGLPSGSYRVSIITQLDPTMYHSEYYNNTPRWDDASLVTVMAPDTVGGIDFLLSRVLYRSISNSLIEATVSDRYPGSNLTVGNTGGLPETPMDDGKDLLFGHPSPYTSFSTIRVDGEDFIYGSEPGDLTTAPFISADGKSITRVWTVQKLVITQKITLVKSTWSLRQHEDTAEIRYTVVNQDNRYHIVGMRIMLDTMLGPNDGAPLMIPYSQYSDYEREFQRTLAPGIPPWWTAIEGDPMNAIFAAQGTMTEGEATMPDRFVTAAWTEVFRTLWDYQIRSDRKVTFDSAVALWWIPMPIAAGGTREIVTYYGLGEAIPDVTPPYTAEHSPMKGATHVSVNSNVALHVRDDHKGWIALRWCSK